MGLYVFPDVWRTLNQISTIYLEKKDYKTVDEDINSLNSNIAKKNEKCTVGCISKGFETRKQVN